jgi:hypothetical protein
MAACIAIILTTSPAAAQLGNPDAPPPEPVPVPAPTPDFVPEAPTTTDEEPTVTLPSEPPTPAPATPAPATPAPASPPVLTPAPVDPAAARAAEARRRSEEALGAVRASRLRSKQQRMLAQSIVRTSAALDGAGDALDRVVNSAILRAARPTAAASEAGPERDPPSPVLIALLATSGLMALVALTPVGRPASLLRRVRAGLAGLSTICLIVAMAVFLRA